MQTKHHPDLTWAFGIQWPLYFSHSILWPQFSNVSPVKHPTRWSQWFVHPSSPLLPMLLPHWLFIQPHWDIYSPDLSLFSSVWALAELHLLNNTASIHGVLFEAPLYDVFKLPTLLTSIPIWSLDPNLKLVKPRGGKPERLQESGRNPERVQRYYRQLKRASALWGGFAIPSV